MLRRFRFLWIAVLTSGLSLPIASAGIIVQDGEFFDADWSAGAFTTGVGRTFFGGTRSDNSPSGSRVEGQPGAYRYSTHAHGGLRNDTMTIRATHLYDAFAWDPSTDGALNQLDVSLDGYVFGTSDGEPNLSSSIYLGIIAEQDGRTYYHSAGGFGDIIPDYDTWFSFNWSGLTSSDFVHVTDPGQPALDFSAGGAALKFGYYMYSERWFTVSSRGGVDNFRLELNGSAIPEPSSALLCGIPCLCLLWRRRTHRQRAAR